MVNSNSNRPPYAILFLLLFSFGILYLALPLIQLVLAIVSSIMFFFLSRQPKSQNIFSSRISLAVMLTAVVLLAFLSKESSSRNALSSTSLTFFFLHVWSYLVDKKRGLIRNGDSWIMFCFYLFYFPKFFVGPIERFSSFEKKSRGLNLGFNGKSIASGFWLIFLGIFRSLILGAELRILTESIKPSIGQFGFLDSVVCILCYSLVLYFEFFGIINIGRGISRIFGLELSENFKSPHLAADLQDFWRRWHITMSEWSRDYLFLPIARYFGSPRSGIILSAISIGFWHRLDLVSFAVGIYHALGMLIHDFVSRRCYGNAFLTKPFFRSLFRLYTLFTISIGLFALSSPSLTFVRDTLLGLFWPTEFTGSLSLSTYYRLIELLMVSFAFEYLAQKKTNRLAVEQSTGTICLVVSLVIFYTGLVMALRMNARSIWPTLIYFNF